jgi:hypothetical protein
MRTWGKDTMLSKLHDSSADLIGWSKALSKYTCDWHLSAKLRPRTPRMLQLILLKHQEFLNTVKLAVPIGLTPAVLKYTTFLDKKQVK